MSVGESLANARPDLYGASCATAGVRELFDAVLERGTARSAAVLAVRVTLRQPCPSCGAGHAYRDSGGEQVRSRALRVTETGCKCLACGASWPAEKFVAGAVAGL